MHFRHAPWRCYGHHISCARLREFPLAPITNLFYRPKGYSKDDNKKHFDASVMMTLNKSVENPQQKTVLRQLLFQNCRHYIATVINGAFFEKKKNELTFKCTKKYLQYFLTEKILKQISCMEN